MLKCQYIHYIDVKSNELFYASYANFLSSPPPWMHSGNRDRKWARRKAEKEEYGICV